MIVMNTTLPALCYSSLCTVLLKEGIPRDVLHADGDAAAMIDTTFARILGDPSAPRAMPFTRRVRQAAIRLSARLGAGVAS